MDEIEKRRPSTVNMRPTYLATLKMDAKQRGFTLSEWLERAVYNFLPANLQRQIDRKCVGKKIR